MMIVIVIKIIIRRIIMIILMKIVKTFIIEMIYNVYYANVSAINNDASTIDYNDDMMIVTIVVIMVMIMIEIKRKKRMAVMILKTKMIIQQQLRHQQLLEHYLISANQTEYLLSYCQSILTLIDLCYVLFHSLN